MSVFVCFLIHSVSEFQLCFLALWELNLKFSKLLFIVFKYLCGIQHFLESRASTSNQIPSCKLKSLETAVQGDQFRRKYVLHKLEKQQDWLVVASQSAVGVRPQKILRIKGISGAQLQWVIHIQTKASKLCIINNFWRGGMRFGNFFCGFCPFNIFCNHLALMMMNSTCCGYHNPIRIIKQ